MKILVPVKRVVDYNVKVRVKADGSGVELANVKMSMKAAFRIYGKTVFFRQFAKLVNLVKTGITV